MTVDTEVNTAVYSEVIATIDPSKSGSSLANDTGYVRAYVSFLVPDDLDGNKSTSDWIDVDNDIISLTTDQGTSKQEGDATSKMTVTLNNRGMKYAEKIIPQLTIVASFVEVERNVVSGKMLSVVRETFPLFFGRVQEVNMNNETCVVDCGDESSTMESSTELDLTFFPTKTAKERVQEIVDAMDPAPMLFVERLADETNDIEIESYAETTQSGQSNVSTTLKDMSLDWAVPSDQLFRLIIFGSEVNYRAGNDNPDMTEFTLDPGDGESIIGHCNNIVVVGDSVLSTDGKDKNVPSSNSNDMRLVKDDPESIEKYGKLESKVYSFPNVATTDQLTKYAENLLDVYKSYENRVLTPTIISKIPMLGSKFNYSLHGIYSLNGILYESDVISVTVKMLRKRVNYDTSGVVCQLECKRWEEELEANEKVPDSWARQAEQDEIRNAGKEDWSLWMKNPDTGAVMLYPSATEAEKDAFINNRINPVNWNTWNKDYTGTSPWGETYKGKLTSYT